MLTMLVGPPEKMTLMHLSKGRRLPAASALAVLFATACRDVASPVTPEADPNLATTGSTGTIGFPGRGWASESRGVRSSAGRVRVRKWVSRCQSERAAPQQRRAHSRTW